MATHFKELATAVAKGMNFEENSIILATATEKENDEFMLDTLVFLKGNCCMLLENIIKAMYDAATDEERHILNTKIKNIYEEILEGRSNHE